MLKRLSTCVPFDQIRGLLSACQPRSTKFQSKETTKHSSTTREFAYSLLDFWLGTTRAELRVKKCVCVTSVVTPIFHSRRQHATKVFFPAFTSIPYTRIIVWLTFSFAQLIARDANRCESRCCKHFSFKDNFKSRSFQYSLVYLFRGVFITFPSTQCLPFHVRCPSPLLHPNPLLSIPPWHARFLVADVSRLHAKCLS